MSQPSGIPIHCITCFHIRKSFDTHQCSCLRFVFDENDLIDALVNDQLVKDKVIIDLLKISSIHHLDAR